MKINKLNLFTLIVIFFNNFLAFPFLVISILKKKENIFLIGLFFGVLGYYFNFRIMSDLGRYYLLFNSSEKIRNIFWEIQGDYYAKFIVENLIKFKLPKELLGAISAFITYYFLFKSLKILLDKNNINKFRCLRYILFYLAIPILGYTGIRFFPAVAIMIYSIVLKYGMKNKKYIFFSLISILIHKSMILMVIFLFLEKYIHLKKRVLNIIIIFFCFLSFFINANILEYINKVSPITIPQVYINGIWGEGFKTTLTELGKILNLYILPIYTRILILVYSLNIKLKRRIEYYLFLIMISILIFLNFRTLYIRYFRFLAILISLDILTKNNAIKVTSIIFLLIFGYNLFYFGYDLNKYYLDIISSYSNFLRISLSDIILKIIK